MAKGKRFDKKTAKTFSVVHRSHEDSLYFDNEASTHVLVEVPQRKEAKKLSSHELAPQLTETELSSVRPNEGEAAQYGIFFDDSKYDYMQHLRPMGNTDGVFIEAKAGDEKPKGRNIEDLIKDALPSEKSRKVTHDDLENIPAELRGFNPDMDSRLREVLVALEDEAYVENEAEDGDIFADLLQSGEVEEEDFYDEEDEWDMDNYDDDYEAYDDLDYEPQQFEQENPYNAGEAPEDAGSAVVDTAWQKDFMKFKKTQGPNDWDSDNEFEEDEDTVGELPVLGKKKPKNKLRKKMGAMTDTSSFSMSLSALFRTDGLTLLDDRYEQLARKYDEEEETPVGDFDMKNERPDFEDMLDDFLDNYETERGGRKLVRKDKMTESAAIRAAADSVSKSKLAERRRKGKDEGKDDKKAVDKLGGSFGLLRI